MTNSIPFCIKGRNYAIVMCVKLLALRDMHTIYTTPFKDGKNEIRYFKDLFLILNYSK